MLQLSHMKQGKMEAEDVINEFFLFVHYFSAF